MVDLNSPAAFTLFIIVVIVGGAAFHFLRWWRTEGRPPLREQIARHNSQLLTEAGLIYQAPRVETHTQEVRER